jgi:hypothetical protein
VKLHLLCATNQVPLSYELTPANIADVYIADVCLTEELINEAALGEDVARKLLAETWPTEQRGFERGLGLKVGILLATEPSERRHGVRQHIEIALSSLKRVFGLGATLASTLVGLATRILRPRSAPTPTLLWSTGCWGRPQGHIKELWA